MPGRRIPTGQAGRNRLLLSAALFALAACSAAHAQTTAPDDEDQTAARSFVANWHIVKRFDFDEARHGNEGDLPMYWYRRRGDDFPRYAAGAWDRTFGYRSNESFRLSLDGGNLGYYYKPSTVLIAPGQDVRVEAMVHTRKLNHARALLKVYFTDARRQVIAGSERRSRLLGGAGENDQWHRVAVLVPGKFASARYVNVEVFLLQPSLWHPMDPAESDEPHLIDYIDVHGDAWFDDITIYRLPRVTLTTGEPGQLLPAGADAKVAVTVEGFANQPLEAVLAVQDSAGRLIGHQVFGSRGDDKTNQRVFQWTGGKLPAGIYFAELHLFAGGARKAGLPALLVRNLTFAQLAPSVRTTGRRNDGFGLIVPAPPGAMDEVSARQLADEQVDLLGRLPVSLVKLPLWRGQAELGDIEESDPWSDQLIRRLARRRMGLVATFGQIPRQLENGSAAQGNARYGLRMTLLDVFASDPATWRPYVAALLARYSEQIRYWQIGAEDSVAFAMDPRFVSTMAAVRGEFRTLVTAPTFVVTWPAMYSWRHGHGAATTGTAQRFPAETANIYLSSRIPPESTDAYLREFMDMTGSRPWATVQPLDPAGYDRWPRLADLAWRLVRTSTALAEPVAPAPTDGPAASGSLFLPAPWTVRELSGHELVEPTEELLIFRTAGELLGGARYGGQMELADGIIAHIFDRGNGDGVLAVRNVGGDPTAGVQLFLGDKPQRVDLWGNRQPLDVTGDKQHLTAGKLPFYVDGIDPRVARLRASFKLTPDFVPSSYEKHSRKVTFINTFDMPISGRLTLHFPRNWEVHPKVIPFSVGAGEAFSREVEIRFPYNAEAGTKQLIGDFQIDADRTYRIQVASRFEFGLGDVSVRTLTQWLPDEQLLVTMHVTNRSDTRLDMFCFVVAPGRPRQERVIAGLLPGASVVKSFRIPAAGPLVGQSLRVGLREVKGSRIVNYAVPVR